MKKIVFQGARQCNQNMEGKLTVTFREARITQHEGIWNLKSQRRNSAKDTSICQNMRALNIVHFYLIL